MKTFVAAAICVIIATSAFAEDDWRSKCEAIAGLAEKIMQSRQNGAPMAKMMQFADGKSKKLVELLVIKAYEGPQYSTEEMQQRSIEEFRDDAYLECFKVMRPE